MIVETILAIVAFIALVVLAFLNDRKKSNRYEEPEDLQTLLGVVAPPAPTKTGPKHRKTKGKHRA